VAASIDFSGTIGDDLHDSLREARAAGATATDPVNGAVLVLRYGDIDGLTRDRRLAGVGLSLFDFMGISDGPLRDWYGGIMFTNEGDTHNRLRALVSRAFTPRSVDALRDDARALSSDAIASVRETGSGDLVELFGRIPIRVMCRLLGVPEADVAVFGDWADALSPTFGFMTTEQVVDATAAITSLLDYVRDLADRRRADPSDDLISALLAAEDDGQRLSHDELVSMVANLIVGGHDTTASQLGCTLLTLLRHPDAVRKVRGDPTLASSAASETIRFEPSIAGIPRTTIEPIDIEDTSVPAGALVLLMTAAANREPSVWKDPDLVDVTRFTDPNAPKLLSFGAGPHYCLGAALARLTVEEAVRAVVDGPDLTPAFDVANVEWRSILGRSPVSLPVTVDAG
jgi:cytochrome P450